MKIELTDRQAWLVRVRAAIDAIQRERAKRDADYEARWAAKYQERGKWRWLIGPLSETPVKGRDDSLGFYPSIYAWGDLEKLKRIEQALLTEGTGAVFVSGDEMRAIL